MSAPIYRKKIVLFSGGRTSGFMLRRLIDKYKDFLSRFIVIFCNTGKERNETLDFVHEVETRWKVPIVWIEYHRVLASEIPCDVFPTKKRNQNLKRAADGGETTHWFRVVNYETASRKGEPFDELLNWATVLPNVVKRSCSMQLKIRSASRYLFSTGLKEFCPNIGIRNDESERAIQILSNCDSFEHPEFPLIEDLISIRHVNDFWKQNDFDLQLESYEGNCDLCFLKSKAKRVRIARENPSIIDWWIDAERLKAGDGTGTKFIPHQPYSLIDHLSKNYTPDLFDESEKDIPCSCAERAFDGKDDE